VRWGRLFQKKPVFKTRVIAARLDSAFRLPQPDRSPIYQWARKHVVLPESYAIPGHFNATLSPWLIPIFAALQDETVRVVTVSKSIQSAGTLIADVWVPWLIANCPGPISWTMHTDDMVERHAKTRLNPILERCKPVADLLPRPGPLRTTTEVYFGGFFLVLNSANLSDQQSQSIRFKINDEIWHPRWQPIYKEAIGRVTKFEEMGTSKVLNISQGGWENDVSDAAWRAGHMAEWSARCPSCHQLHPLAFRQNIDKENAMKWAAGVVFDPAAKRDDGTYDESRAIETAHFRCPHCGHETPDDDRTREHWRRTGEYSATRPDAPRENRSFHFEALPTRPMRLLVQQWVEAENEFAKTGSDEARRVFRQKREARAWVEERRTITVAGGSEYAIADYFDGKKTPNELHRFMTVDRQLRGRWVEIGAFAPGPAYRQLFFGLVDSTDQVRALQLRYGVPDSCVAQDRRYEPNEVDKECVRYGWRGMVGHKKKTWTMLNEATGLMENFPHSEPRFSNVGAEPAVFYDFSSYHTKDIVATAASGQSFPWLLPRDVNPLYPAHLKAEEKKEVRPGAWEWVEVKQNANHGFDTSSMMVAVAVVAGLVKFTLSDDKA
jgi:hypothetical protein